MLVDEAIFSLFTRSNLITTEDYSIRCFWNVFCVQPDSSYIFLIKVKVKIKLRTTVSQPVRPGVRHPSGNRDQFFPFSLWLFLDSFGFVDMGSPLWREVRSVLFSFCRASSAQPFSDLSPTGLRSIFFCLSFLDSLNLEDQVPLFTRPKVRGSPVWLAGIEFL
jgi:hypothetical protein